MRVTGELPEFGSDWCVCQDALVRWCISSVDFRIGFGSDFEG